MLVCLCLDKMSETKGAEDLNGMKLYKRFCGTVRTWHGKCLVKLWCQQ